jgi:hypothetical protein
MQLSCNLRGVCQLQVAPREVGLCSIKLLLRMSNKPATNLVPSENARIPGTHAGLRV